MTALLSSAPKSATDLLYFLDIGKHIHCEIAVCVRQRACPISLMIIRVSQSHAKAIRAL